MDVSLQTPVSAPLVKDCYVKLWTIAIPCFEAHGDTTSFPVDRRAPGFALASDALIDAGLFEGLGERHVRVLGSSRIELNPDTITGDPIIDLGRHGAMVAETVRFALESGAHPLIAGGTCNHVTGILSGLQQAYGPAARIGVIWFDAHGDINTPRTSTSGMTWGMPFAVPLGLCYPEWREGAGMTAIIPSNRVVFVDVRNLDPWEAQFIEASDAVVGTLVEGRESPTAEAAISDLADRVDHLYVHVDCDVLDREYVPSLLFAAPDGPSLERTSAAIAEAMATGKVRAFGVVSFDPTGAGGETSRDSAMTLILEGTAAWKVAVV